MSPDLTRTLAGLMLLAIAPVVAYGVDRSAAVVVLSIVCVLLVTGSLYLMFGPSEHAGGHETA